MVSKVSKKIKVKKHIVLSNNADVLLLFRPDCRLWSFKVAPAVRQQRLGVQAHRDGWHGDLHAPREVRALQEPPGRRQARRVQVRPVM